MRIAILAEGKTEMAFKPHLIVFLQTRLAGKMPKLALQEIRWADSDRRQTEANRRESAER